MFTKNIREAYRNVTYRFRHWFYATTNLTFVPMYGFFPVKLKCYIGKAMPYDANNTPEMLAQMVSFYSDSENNLYFLGYAKLDLKLLV